MSTKPELTKREYFALTLANGLLAASDDPNGEYYSPEGLANIAFEFADAMLARSREAAPERRKESQ